MLRPKIRPQIHHLPRPQPDQHPHSPVRKPLHPLIGALVGIAQLLLPRAQVVHLGHDLGDQFLHAAQLRLDGFEFLLRLDRGPVARVGADVDVEFDVACGVHGWVCGLGGRKCWVGGLRVGGGGEGELTGCGELVFETDVEGGVGVGGECHSGFAG